MSSPWEDFSPPAGPWSDFAAPRDPQIGQPQDLTFAEKYLAPALEKMGLGDVAGGNVRGSAVGRLAMGAADPGVALFQLGANAVGQGEGVNKSIAGVEQQYQDARKAAGSTGFDPWRLTGNIGMTAFAGAAMPGSLPEQLGTYGKAAVQGAGYSALQPVTDGGNYWGEKGKQAAIGAVVGPATALVGQGLARIVSPNASVNPDLALLKNEGVASPSIGQTLGGWANALEQKAQSLPIVGPAISAARERGATQLESAGLNRGMPAIGETISETGNAGISEASSKLGAQYEKILPKLSVNVTDPAFVARISSLRDMVQTLPEKEQKQFDAVISREIDGRVLPDGTLGGQSLKDAWNALRDTAQTFSRSNDAYQSQLGQAFKQTFQELKDHVAATNPAADVSALKNVDFAYANFKRMQRAASSVAAEGGSPTPAQMYNAVKAMDTSKDKARFAEGTALMQDLAGAGKRVLSNKVPDSGTAGRGMLGALVAGTPFAPHYTLPAMAGLAAGAAAYTPPVQNALRALVTKRPDMAPQVANELRRIMQAGGVVTVPMVEAMAR